MEHTTFHEWLAGRMESAGMTPSTLAEKMRGDGYTVSRQSASHWRQGRCKPAPKLWAPLAYALGVSPADVAAVLAADAMDTGEDPPKEDASMLADLIGQARKLYDDPKLKVEWVRAAREYRVISGFIVSVGYTAEQALRRAIEAAS